MKPNLKCAVSTSSAVVCPAEQAVGSEQQWATHSEVLAGR